MSCKQSHSEWSDANSSIVQKCTDSDFFTVVGHSIGYVYGPHICGDSIDSRDDVVLTGSYHNKDVLQLWSISMMKHIKTIIWDPKDPESHSQGYIYSAMFERGKKNRFVMAGGGGKNEVRIFNNKNEHELMAKIAFAKTVTTLDFANEKGIIAAGCKDGSVHDFVMNHLVKSSKIY